MHRVFLFVVFLSYSNGLIQEGTKKNISKCCPENEYIVKGKKCVKHNKTLDFSTLELFDAHLKKSDKSFVDIFELVYDDFDLKNAWCASNPNTDVFLTEDGIFYQKFSQPNAFSRWATTKLDNLCVDYLQRKNGDVVLRFFAKAEYSPPSIYKDTYYITTSLLSCFFLTLVLAVYCILPELRNLVGLILMSYVFSLLGAYALLNALRLTLTFNPTFIGYTSCMTFTASIYYFFLAAFFWVNVMSYDILCTFRGRAKVKQASPDKVRHKYRMYCAYAWGTPALMTSALVILNHVDLTHIPCFITPNIYKSYGCFLSEGEKLLYLYFPMLILIISNCVFFYKTSHNVKKRYRSTEKLATTPDSNTMAHRNQKNRLMVYIKLAIIMGLSWILEVVSTIKPDLGMWYITDSYNLLIGVAIFLIFVCKQNILRNLRAKFCNRVLRNRQEI